ncbi:hypothetical protein O181_067223 [Austropuccinia psidii MF-1]|uniref:Uncharacterized protein n=1 Tax=Austropuccinia psidii MF-1 TaxID=1389203 RepID=A0A9Q3ESY2_9BASI|nr:hypothetical protein [Austropuccinia psidii MF-1]
MIPVKNSPPARQTRSQKEDQSWKEGRGPRMSNSFSRGHGFFSGISRTTFNGSAEDEAEDEGNSVEEEKSDSTVASCEP